VARQVNQVAPTFPLRAIQMRWEVSQEHVVRLKVFVSEQGQPLKVSILESVSGGYGFDEAAIDAANKSTYAPATRDGKPVRGWTAELNYKFPKRR
jgi:TonB family protein